MSEKKASELLLDSAHSFDAGCIKVLELEKQLEDQQKETDKLKGALRYLVDVKDHKDMKGKDEVYLKNQPKAWIKAREALAQDKE